MVCKFPLSRQEVAVLAVRILAIYFMVVSAGQLFSTFVRILTSFQFMDGPGLELYSIFFLIAYGGLGAIQGFAGLVLWVKAICVAQRIFPHNECPEKGEEIYLGRLAALVLALAGVVMVAYSLPDMIVSTVQVCMLKDSVENVAESDTAQWQQLMTQAKGPTREEVVMDMVSASAKTIISLLLVVYSKTIARVLAKKLHTPPDNN